MKRPEKRHVGEKRAAVPRATCPTTLHVQLTSATMVPEEAQLLNAAMLCPPSDLGGPRLQFRLRLSQVSSKIEPCAVLRNPAAHSRASREHLGRCRGMHPGSTRQV